VLVAVFVIYLETEFAATGLSPLLLCVMPPEPMCRLSTR